MGEIVAGEIGDRKLTEHVVEDRRRVLDRSLPCTKPAGSKRVKVKASTYSSSGTPYCRPSEIAMAKLFIIARKRALLVHVDEDLAEAPSSYSPVRSRPCGRRQRPSGYSPCGDRASSRGRGSLHALDDPLDDLLRHLRRLGGGGSHQSLHRILGILVLIGNERRVERLRKLGAVAVESVCLQRQAPGEHVGALAILDRGVVRHVDGLGDRTRDEGLRRRIMRMWLSTER